MPNLYMLIGVSYSGKSTFAKQQVEKQPNIVVHSSDAIRKELFNDENTQSNNTLVFETLHKRVIEDLKNGKDIIYDATNLSMKRRKNFLKNIEHIDCYKIAICMLDPIEELLNRCKNSNRERKVSEEVVIKQLKSFQMPSCFEGFNEVCLGRGELRLFNLKEELQKCWNTPHESLYHKENIGQHMAMVEQNIKKIDFINSKEPYYSNITNNERNILMAAARYHDIGKPFCKTFVNTKGDTTEVAHYYGHQNVGAYMFLTSLNEDGSFFDEHFGILFDADSTCIIAQLIQYHMEPLLREEKGLEKFYNLIGQQLTKLLFILNEADKKGRII